MAWLGADLDTLKALLHDARRVVVVSHANPDGDTLGSNMALSMALAARGKQVVSVCADQVPERYRVFSEDWPFIQSFPDTPSDLAIFVDTADAALTQIPWGTLPTGAPIINIDHHKDNGRYGTLNLIDSSAPSTTFLLLLLFERLGWDVTPDMATALLLGLVTDTGGFFHSNTTSEGYDAAARLLSLGADSAAIGRRVFHDFDPRRLKLWGRVLERASMNADHVVSSVVFNSDFRETGTTAQDLEGVVEYLNMVPEGRYALLLTEDGKNASVKGSLRARADDVDVSEIAHRFGGGGHPKASGFRIKGKLMERKVWEVVSDEGNERLTV